MTKRKIQLAKQFKLDLKGKTAVFIDYANMKSWLAQMGYFINLEALYKHLKSYSRVERIYFYYGTDFTNPKSSNFIQKVRQFGYDVTTKPVKYINVNLTDLLNKPGNRQMIDALDKKTRSRLVSNIASLVQKGIRLTLPKCNFDVEITKDMILFKDSFDTAVLFSGDSDFAEILKFLRGKDKNVIVVSTRRFLSGELAQVADTFVNFKRFLKVEGLLYKQNKNPRRGS